MIAPNQLTTKTPWEDKFIEALSENGGNVTRAAATANISRQAAYDRYHANDVFRSRWEIAQWEGVDVALAEVHRRGVEGVERPVFQGGEQVGTVREYSDSLLMFLVKGRRKEFCDPKHQINVGAAADKLTETKLTGKQTPSELQQAYREEILGSER